MGMRGPLPRVMNVIERALVASTLLPVVACTSENQSQPVHSPRPSTTSPTPTYADETGTLRGQLLFVGGPPSGKPRPLTGFVTFAGPTRTHVRVGRGGQFLARLPTGVYRVVGHSPQYGYGRSPCFATSTASVVAGTTVHVDVFCQGR